MKMLLILPVLLVPACMTQQKETALAPQIHQEHPSLEEAGNIIYHGIDGATLTLVDGRWEGEPWVEGGAARPSAGLAESLDLSGDVDGDGNDEAIVLLWTSSGGSGTFDYIAVVDRDDDGKAVNTGTALLGDRVKVRAAGVVAGRLVLDVLQAGPNDAMCCPGQKVRRTFILQESGLVEAESQDLGRVSAEEEPGSN